MTFFVNKPNLAVTQNFLLSKSLRKLFQKDCVTLCWPPSPRILRIIWMAPYGNFFWRSFRGYRKARGSLLWHERGQALHQHDEEQRCHQRLQPQERQQRDQTPCQERVWHGVKSGSYFLTEHLNLRVVGSNGDHVKLVITLTSKLYIHVL